MLLGYVRVSTRDQTEGTSPAEQERVVRSIALARGLGPFEVTIYRDDGVSGSVPLRDRPEGKRMIDAAQRGDTIVAAKLDRCFRDALDALEVFNHCKANGIDLVLYDLGHTSVIRDGISKLMFTIVTAFAEMERTRIRERVLDGKRAKKLKGGHVGGLAPYGFRKIGDGRDARLEPDATEQQDIEVIRHVYRHSDSLGQTCAELTRLGLTNRVGNPLSRTQVQRIVER